MRYIDDMSNLVRALLCLCLGLAPATAQDTGKSVDDGVSLLEEGARINMRSLLDDMEPAINEMKKGLGKAAAEMGPALRELFAKIDDIRNFNPPEVLPNGDIILRRKTPAEMPVPEPGAQIEL